MKRAISLFVSLGILLIIYLQIDYDQVVGVLQAVRSDWLLVSFVMVIPITGVTAWRLRGLVPLTAQMYFCQALQLILTASSLNMVLPSKLGDLAKSVFMRDKGGIKGTLAFSIVVFEKTLDLLALMAWCAIGLLFYAREELFFLLLTMSVIAGLLGGLTLLASRRCACYCFSLKRYAPPRMQGRIESLQESWGEMQAYFWGDRWRIVYLFATSMFLWFLHLLQIWLFVISLGTHVSFITSMGLASLAIFAGLLPLTFAGIGTRDAALIMLYSPYMDVSTGAALGVLCTMRYVLPALAGIPFLAGGLAMLKRRGTENPL